MMKTKLLLTGLAIIAATSLTIAQPQGKGNEQGKGQGNGQGKGNGKCMAYCRGNGQGNGQGSCPNKIKGNGKAQGQNGSGNCYRYTDENKNGVCDRYEARTKK